MEKDMKIVSMNASFERTEYALLVCGELYGGGSSVSGTEITLSENGEIAQKYVCCLNGDFYFRLDYEKKYSIRVSKEGFEPKIIEFDTALRGHQARRRHYEFGVSLRPAAERPLDKLKDHSPVAIIRYDPATGLFEHDREHYAKRKAAGDRAA